MSPGCVGSYPTTVVFGLAVPELTEIPALPETPEGFPAELVELVDGDEALPGCGSVLVLPRDVSLVVVVLLPSPQPRREKTTMRTTTTTQTRRIAQRNTKRRRRSRRRRSMLSLLALLVSTRLLYHQSQQFTAEDSRCVVGESRPSWIDPVHTDASHRLR